jgi:hypothetical protein
MKGMKAKPEYIEGPEAWQRFEHAMKRIITVPHSDIKRRIEAERAKSAVIRSDGPKRKRGALRRTRVSSIHPHTYQETSTLDI